VLWGGWPNITNLFAKKCGNSGGCRLLADERSTQGNRYASVEPPLLIPVRHTYERAMMIFLTVCQESAGSFV
jgi:hypothetical protein